ncbi:hypothetical protein C8T65DRAFT_235246 [Cerioporus squamosus]|nr:hypothetical protein C8T65DRAFT_235246 [Cerioporus squamosus]
MLHRRLPRLLKARWHVGILAAILQGGVCHLRCHLAQLLDSEKHSLPSISSPRLLVLLVLLLSKASSAEIARTSSSLISITILTSRSSDPGRPSQSRPDAATRSSRPLAPGDVAISLR